MADQPRRENVSLQSRSGCAAAAVPAAAKQVAPSRAAPSQTVHLRKRIRLPETCMVMSRLLVDRERPWQSATMNMNAVPMTAGHKLNATADRLDSPECPACAVSTRARRRPFDQTA